MLPLRHTISFNLDLELNQKTQNEPIIFASYYNLIEGNFHSDHSNSIIFEDKLQQSGHVCAGIIKCHVKTSIFDHFVVELDSFRQVVLVKNENVKIGPAGPTMARFEAKLHYATDPQYVGYFQTSYINKEVIPNELFTHINPTNLQNKSIKYQFVRIGRIIGYLHFNNKRFMVIYFKCQQFEIVLEKDVIQLAQDITRSLKCSSHYYKGNMCQIVSTYMVGMDVLHSINCVGTKMVDCSVSSKYMFSTNLNREILQALKNDDKWVIDDIVNFNDYMSQYKGDSK